MEQQSLFGNRAGQDMPLATRMRPRTLEEFAGQRHLLGKGKVLRQLIEEDVSAGCGYCLRLACRRKCEFE